jgi:hypothetical protein
MSERINVDHAFDPEARQAQADLDAYMDSRPYQDEKGNTHDAETGSFIKKDDFRYGESDKHYEESLSEGDYSGESLEQLAQRVADARKDGDKTRAGDAEEAFMDKFYEYAEKYGWDEPNVDANASADRQSEVLESSLGRDTIDARLERYGKIMYGESAETAKPETEEAPASEGEADKPDIRIEPWQPPMSAEEAGQKLESVRRVREGMEAEQTAADDEPEYDSEAQQQRLDERLGDAEPIATEGLEDMQVEDGPIAVDQLEPLEIPVQDGESLEGYEHRIGTDTEAIETAGLEDIEGEEPEARRSRRLRDRFSPTALAARLTTANFLRKKKNAERETEDDSKEHSRKRLALGLGVLTVAAVGVGVILANKYGVDYQPGNGGGNGGNGGGGAGGGGNRLNWNDFDPSARKVTNGEGWFSTFKQMGIPKSEWNDVLTTAGPKLGKLGEAYYDNGAGEWRISRPGQLSSDALRVIANSSRKNGVEL